MFASFENAIVFDSVFGSVSVAQLGVFSLLFVAVLALRLFFLYFVHEDSTPMKSQENNILPWFADFFLWCGLIGCLLTLLGTAFTVSLCIAMLGAALYASINGM